LLGNPRSAWAFELKRLPVAEASPEREGEIRKLVLTARPSKSNPLWKILPPAYSSGEVIEALGKMSAMSPRDFEYFIRDALLASDFREVRVTRQSDDEGIDVVAKFPESIWTFPKQTIQIQAKRWKNSVGRKVVAEFRGSLSPRAVGAILTTSHFAQTAIREAERPNSLPVSLVDGHQLAFAALRLGLLK
jgi:restriction endonuclease Mrr